MKLEALVRTSERVRDASGRNEKTEHLAAALRQAGPTDVDLAVTYLSGRTRQGRIGIGPALLRDARPGESADAAELTLRDVDRALERIAGASGSGVTALRAGLLRDLLARATRAEQDFLVRLVFGELRQGANAGVMADAIARAADVKPRAVRRAAMLSGDPAEVARVAFAGGTAALAAFGVRLFRPIEPMLASPADSASEALDRTGPAAVEFKMDGARVQVHKAGRDVAVFSRNLRDVTESVPELVEVVAALPVPELVLDGEILALTAGGRPEPFQVTMRRFGRKLDVVAQRAALPLSPFFFDCIYAEGESLIDEPASLRYERMGAHLPDDLEVPRIVTERVEDVEAALSRARAAGHEGIMVKDLTSTYAAGRRGKSWLKVKPAHTLDLVVLAAEWGHGRRRGLLSNLHLGARDPESGQFVMLGKTFKGLTDDLLSWQTRALQELEVSRDRHTVYVEPRLVVEIAFNEVQESPRYPGGVALRFARVKAYRPDKRPEDADTIATVRAIHAAGP